ncbi:MAG: preprotein translocase subunit YajC [Candidatus Delongbacteria bacterium]|nr:preprotein translocase subunit YajC [Candidatus Delongbacteria bacterium]
MFVSEIFAMGTGGGSQASGPAQILSFLPFILLIVIFYFFIIRPQQKRQKDHAKMVETLKKGDRVVTNTGIYGTIVSIENTVAVLKIADVKGEPVKIEVLKSSIAGTES